MFRFLLGGGHDFSHITTYPFKNRVTHNEIQEATTKGPIIIGDDVWIGYGAIILSGVTIGQGAVIGAGSIVAKDIPPYAVFAGGEIKKYRFNESIIKKLSTIDLGSIDYAHASESFELLYTSVTEKNIDELIAKLNLKVK